MYTALFGIKKYPSGNSYLVTKLVPLILGCTFVPFVRNITGPFTTAALPTRRTVIENLESLQFCHGGVCLFSQEHLAQPNCNGRRFHPKTKLKVMSETSKNITRWVCPYQILPLCLNHNVPMVLLWHIDMWSFRSCCLRCNHPPMPLQIWQPLFPNKSTEVILYLKEIICLSYIWYNLYNLLPWHPNVCRVSCNNYIFNILHLSFQWQHSLSQREVIGSSFSLVTLDVSCSAEL